MTHPDWTTSIAQLCRAVPGALLPVVPDDPEATARAVHISELVDPTSYLDGGELLMTTGMALPMTPSGCRAYVLRLRDHGVAALALGLGPVHAKAPTVLVRACDRAGLPLLVVPAAVPFQRLTRAFWTLAGGAQERELQEALMCQHRLVIAAAAPDPLPGILEALAKAIDGHAVVTDLRGHPRLASSGDWPYDPQELKPAIERLRHAGPRAAATLPLGEHNAVLHPVVSGEDVVSYLGVVSNRSSTNTRNLVLMTLALLGMEATNRRMSLTSRHPARAAIAHLVDRGQKEAVSQLAEHLGVQAPPERVRVVVANSHASTTLEALLTALPDHTDRWWGTTADRGAWLMLQPELPEPDPHEITTALADFGSLARVVIGPVVELKDVRVTRTKLAARACAVTPGTAQSWRSQETVPCVTREWAEATLSPLVQLGEGLLATVASYLRHRGSWQATATDLGLHRNSVRAHIARAERALGVDLRHPDTMARLWLALRETTVVDDPA